MPPAVNVFCSPTLDGDLTQIEASLRNKIKTSGSADDITDAVRATTAASKTTGVSWGSSLKLNFDRCASPSWVGSMVSSPHFVQRYNESNDKQRRDILRAFPALARGVTTDRASDLGLTEEEIPRLRVPPILKKQTRWSKKMPWARPILREMEEEESDDGCMERCQETICWFGALSEPALCLTDDESDDSETLLLGSSSSSDEQGEYVGAASFDPVIYLVEPSAGNRSVGRVSL
mmetsp:Transcript_16329/g.32852  ORF Transcript_16329/g.32852 Transcript_16329/m.32852 type:complete len:234 (-) Transcript_16329:679-1380(-)